jgi:hypothetical protein
VQVAHSFVTTGSVRQAVAAKIGAFV